MKDSRNIRPNRKRKSSPSGKKRPLIALLVLLVLLGSIVFTLDRIKSRVQPPETPRKGHEVRQALPQHPSYPQAEQQPYTSTRHEPFQQPRVPRKKGAVGPGTVAIIVDDMGTNLQEAQALMAINVPLTFSLIPGLPRVREVAESAHAKGYPVMIHLPMEPQGYPQQRLEANGLLLAQSDDEIARRMEGYIRGVPHAAGANNHMGSRFTEDSGKMLVVLNQLKARGLYFVDSRTSPRSVGLSLARSIELDSAGRNVFLDNVQDVEAIRGQLNQLASLARKRGSAIAICHPRKTTIQALAAALPAMKAEGITFVPVAELVR